ncbi:MAG TPA: 23S rRNA (guanosine(2251)-2'-O)-methyltransferase RlmB [Hyphomicrobiaceae bacterium]|nr:23S rRNA (guanosine(2251)-2'-O)-methyltransferase RlmB [Hyphomicrobiaceae bacterium]
MREKQGKGRPTWWRSSGKGKDRPVGSSAHPTAKHHRSSDRANRATSHAEGREDPFASGDGGRERAEDTFRLYGIHAVAAAVANPNRRIVRLFLTDNAEKRLAESLKGREIAKKRVDPRDLDRLLGSDTVHQGVMAEVEPLDAPTLEDLAERAKSGGPLVVLDQVTDPHNVGAILRSAAVFGAAGLVMTRRHSPPISGALAKAASGALEHVPVALVANLARALSELEELGVRRIGLDGEAAVEIESEDFSGGIALVLGAEGSGLRRLSRESCDVLVRIGASGAIASLNVSNAAAVALHVAAQRRKAASK